MSAFVLRAIAKRAEITLRGRAGHPRVSASDVDALLRDTRRPTGNYRRGSVPYGGLENAAEVCNL